MTDHLKHSDTGHLLSNASGHMVHACNVIDAPCFCPGNLASSYAINPQLLSACASCEGGSCSTTESWDGTFQQYGTCNWQGLNAQYTNWTAGQCFELDSKNLSTIQIRLDPYDCQWVLTLNCFSSGGENTIWEGVKTTGLTPSGLYNRTNGCSLPMSLEVY